MMKYLFLICVMGITMHALAQQQNTVEQPLIQFSGGYSYHLKHKLSGFSVDITGIKKMGKQWFLQYGGGFQQYWGTDPKFGDFLNAFDEQILVLESLAPLRLQTAGIQLQLGVGRNINSNLNFGMQILGRYQGTSVPQSYAVVDVSQTLGTSIQIIDPGYRIDHAPVQELTAGTQFYINYKSATKRWWSPGLKILWQSDLGHNTLFSAHLRWDIQSR